MQIKFKDSVEYDASKYKFEANEERNFELKSFNISKDWKPAELRKKRVQRFGFGYIVYLIVSAPYIFVNSHKKDKGKYVFSHIYQRIINTFGFYRVHYGEYEEPYNSLTKNKYIRGHWFWKELVFKMDGVARNELRVITPLSKENENYLNKISECNSVGVHIRRGDYVTLGLIVCDLDYYRKCMDIMAGKVDDPVFFIFSDDIPWVKKNLNTQYNIIYIDNNNPSPEDMRLLYSCKHFIMSNSTFSWWGAYLGDFENKIVLVPKYWSAKKIKSPLIYDGWIAIENM